MNFELTGEQRSLVESNRSLLAAKAPPPMTRRLVVRAEDFDVKLLEASSDTQV